ncbi:Modulator Of Smoothened Protein [Manis pentadactyla]|nr:Modulator Of Smoothened Protein [Manis pentadactyla]
MQDSGGKCEGDQNQTRPKQLYPQSHSTPQVPKTLKVTRKKQEGEWKSSFMSHFKEVISYKVNCHFQEAEHWFPKLISTPQGQWDLA